MTNQEPTHYKLLNELKAIGPYLREMECETDQYCFDSLSVCIDDQKSPEAREFWGWWLLLEKTDQTFTANYTLGKYNKKGLWDEHEIPTTEMAEVIRTLESFHVKLSQVIEHTHHLNLVLHDNSVCIETD